jgi:hypothetical protein
MRIQNCHFSRTDPFTFTLAVIILCGCSGHETAVEAKRHYAINHVQQAYLNARSPIFRRWGTNILTALSSANVVTLKTPRCASAAMGRDQDGECRLYVFWLEETPSADGVELRLDKTTATTTIAVSPSDTEENVKASKVSVVNVASWIWFNTNSISSKLEKISDVSNLKVRLLRAGAAITDWCPVSFYRLDHWMGTKEVTEVTTGDSAGIKAHN